MHHFRTTAPVRLLLPAIIAGVLLLGCSSATTPEWASAVASVEILPGALPVEPGSSRQLHVIVRAANGRELTGHAISWSVANDAIAFVDAATGRLVAREGGTTQVTATAAGVNGRATIEIAPWVSHALVEAAQQALPSRILVGLYVDDEHIVRTVEVLSLEGTLRVSPSNAYYEQRLLLQTYEDGRFVGTSRLNDRGVLQPEGDAFRFTSSHVQGVTFTGRRSGETWVLDQTPAGIEGPAVEYRYSRD